MNRIKVYFKEVIQVDRTLFRLKEYIVWCLTALVGIIISCYFLGLILIRDIEIQSTVFCLILGLLVTMLVTFAWVTRAISYIEQKENIGKIQNKEEQR